MTDGGVQVSDQPDEQNEETVTDETQQPEADTTPEVQANPEPEQQPEPEQPKQKRGRAKATVKPSEPVLALGRMVRYVTASETVRPAVVTRINEGSVDLTVFNSRGAVPVFDVRPAEYDPEVPLENTYHWPESH
jgi:hypothetical protein